MMTMPHADVAERFIAALRTNRLGHAYLFIGPAGVGKKKFAMDLARSLLCEHPPGELRSCGNCAGCHLVDANTHPDLVVTGKPADKLEFVIESMRKLLADLSMMPARGRRKISIVDDVDDFNDETANCFLKTLEEPPPGSLLLLLGTSPERQLATIRSRCQAVYFRPLDDKAVESKLGAAGITDPALAAKLVRLAAGSPGLAVSLADPELWQARRQLLETVSSDRPDGPALAKAWMSHIEAAGKEAAHQRARAGQLLRLTIDAYRAALGIALGGPPPADDPAEATLLGRLARRGPDKLIDQLERLLDAETHIDRRVQLVLLVEALADALTIEAAPVLRSPRE
jgi:DNA polymerase-3 subunit delta'